MTPLVVRIYEWFCQAIYHEWSWSYDLVSWMVSLGKWSSWREEALKYASGQHILELGFGTGALQAKLSEGGKRVFGLEISPQMHERCRRRLQGKHIHTLRVRADGRCLPFADQSFEHLIATFPEQYITSNKALKECHRVLKKGEGQGSLLITGHWITLDNIFLRPLFPVFYRYPKEGDIEAMQQKLESHGFNFQLHRAKKGLATIYTIEAKV